MKLPISLLVLAALTQALSVPITKRSELKTSETKTAVSKTKEAGRSGAQQKHNDQANKRELFEGNFGERNKEIESKHEVSGPPPKIVFAKELQEMVSEQTPAHQIFGVRLPKISDVLTEHGPSFEAAVASQLYSPVSVYHAKHLTPTTFEVPTPSASQLGYLNPKAYRLQIVRPNEQKLQEVKPKSVKLPNPPLLQYKEDQARLRFDAYPQNFNFELPRQHERLPEEVFRPQGIPRKPMLFPLYDHLGPFKHTGHVVPSQYSHRNGIFQIFPVAREFGQTTQARNRDKNYSSEEDYAQNKGEKSNLQIDVPVHTQGYHAHPNGAISFARFSHNLQGSTQHNTAPQPQSETFHQLQPAQFQSQAIPVQLPPAIQPELMSQSHEQRVIPLKQNLPYPSMLQGLIQDLEKYQPVHPQQLQLNPFNQQMQRQPTTLNALQQHLLLHKPRQSSNLQIIQLPAFKPLPQSLFTPEFHSKKSSRAPIVIGLPPRQVNNNNQSETHDLSLGEASTQLSSLPPLKPNYNNYVKPLESHTTPIFLPTPLQTLPTSTAKVEPVSDQLILSTTIQPDVKSHERPKTQSIQEETESPTKTPQLLKPEEFRQSQATVQPQSVQSTTFLPFVTNEPQSFFQQPIYQTSSRPTPQRHDVVIQRQEIQEIFFEPSRQHSSSPHYQTQPAMPFPLEQELHNLHRTHPHYQLFEQLLPFKLEHQDIHSPQQYIVEARESQQKSDATQQGDPQQYLIQHHANPLQLQRFEQQLLRSQQPELQQSLQVQQRFNQEQQQESELEHQQQQQAQKQESEQAQQQIQESALALQQQYQQNSVESSNQIQISTVTPPQDTEKQTETVGVQQPTESQTELQQDFKLQSSTGKPDEHPAHLLEPTPNLEQPYLGPFLTQSVAPQLYAHQQLFAQTDRSPVLGLPPYSNIQYFGKFAENLFNKQKQPTLTL